MLPQQSSVRVGDLVLQRLALLLSVGIRAIDISKKAKVNIHSKITNRCKTESAIREKMVFQNCYSCFRSASCTIYSLIPVDSWIFRKGLQPFVSCIFIQYHHRIEYCYPKCRGLRSSRAFPGVYEIPSQLNQIG